MDIREKFKLIRKQRKISLRELGNIAGSASSISDFENGKPIYPMIYCFNYWGT